MTYRSADDIKAEAAQRGMRSAFVLTALLSEMEAVRGHLTEHCSAYNPRDGKASIIEPPRLSTIKRPDTIASHAWRVPCSSGI